MMAGFWQQTVGVALGFAIVVGGVAVATGLWALAKMVCPPLESWEQRRILASVDGRAKLREEAVKIDEAMRRWEQRDRRGANAEG
jgi:hypothetical protein